MAVKPAQTLIRRRGNPNWGKAATFPSPVGPTEFERQVKSLGLHEQKYVGSEKLRIWCKNNKNRCYVPEWLLKEWDMAVDANF